MRSAGVDTTVRTDEPVMLWGKLAFLAPSALATTSLDQPLGKVRDDEVFLGCQNEVLAVARAIGVALPEEKIRQATRNAAETMRSSMQRDVEAGREPEL